MNKKIIFDIYLDESGNFEDDVRESVRYNEVSLVGGLLIPTGVLGENIVEELLPEHVHCCEGYNKEYLNILDKIKNLGGRFIVFENKEHIKVVNGDTTYLNIISEGLLKLFRDLKNEFSSEIFLNICIATRKAVNDDKSGIIRTERYRNTLEEKIIIALKRNNIDGCDYILDFKDARRYKKLDFADIICNTWFTRHRKKFTKEEQERIQKLYSDQLIYPVFEDAMTTYIKTLMLDRHIGEAIYQICLLKKLSGFITLRNQLVKYFTEADRYDQESWLGQVSLLIYRYNKLRFYNDGISFAENYKEYFLNIFQKENVGSYLKFWYFDTDYYLLTMYDHLGNAEKCQKYLLLCRQNIDSVNRSWEHIDYYFGFCIRELNVLMGRFAFDEVIEKSEELINIFNEAKSLFGMIKTYNGNEQNVRSELLGKAYGVRAEAYINLLKDNPQLYEEAVAAIKHALEEFDDPRDISRQYQWLCLLMTVAGKIDDAYDSLIKAVLPDEKDGIPEKIIDTIYSMKNGTYDFLIWHYTNVMLLMIYNNDERGELLAKSLLKHPQYFENLNDIKKKGHPYNLTLWNIAKYYRTTGNYAQYKGLYKKALAMTCESKSNITMLSFALSMSADRLLYTKKEYPMEAKLAEQEFYKIANELVKVGMPDEMKNAYKVEEVLTKEIISDEMLEYIVTRYLK